MFFKEFHLYANQIMMIKVRPLLSYQKR